jgi:hypothetical protein
MYEELRDQAEFAVVYIAEAHSVDGWKLASNEEQNIRIEQARSFGQRLEAARLCASRLSLTIPTFVDAMDNSASEAFSAWPERIYIIDLENRIHYPGAPGPYGFNPEEARESLLELISGDNCHLQ